MNYLKLALLSLLALSSSQTCRAESETHKTLTDVEKTVNDSNSRYNQALEDASDEAAKEDSSQSESSDGDEEQVDFKDDLGSEE